MWTGLLSKAMAGGQEGNSALQLVKDPGGMIFGGGFESFERGGEGGVGSRAVVKVLVSVVLSSCWSWGGKDTVLVKEEDGGDGVDEIFRECYRGMCWRLLQGVVQSRQSCWVKSSFTILVLYLEYMEEFDRTGHILNPAAPT